MASILLISREARTVALVRATLSIAGHEVFVADHPSRARREGRRRFQLVLLDPALLIVADDLHELSDRVVLLSAVPPAPRMVGHIPDLTPGALLDSVTRYLATPT
jgi:hypothetical protein